MSATRMQLVRRLVSIVIRGRRQQQEQQRKIQTVTRSVESHRQLTGGSNRGSQLQNSIAGPRPPSQRLLSTFAYQLKHLALNQLNSLTRLALRAILKVGDHSSDNAQLATTSIDRVLRYSYGATPVSSHNKSVNQQHTKDSAMNKERSISGCASADEEGDKETKADNKESVCSPSKMVELEDHSSGNTLESLRKSYADCRKDVSSVWLDFADKSCYIYLYKGGGEPNRAVAAFDLDGTLIKPKSNKRIPRSATDWELFSVWTKIKLQQCLRDRHARFVIFTNQNGVGLEIVPLREVQHRIELVTKSLDVPCTVFMAIEKDLFRKPQIGMFQLFNESFNDELQVDFPESFYCGDAIGYPSHSDADIKFAQKLGFPFLTPEKFLRGVKPKLVQ